jgi:hypothetical protein
LNKKSERKKGKGTVNALFKKTGIMFVVGLIMLERGGSIHSSGKVGSFSRF